MLLLISLKLQPLVFARIKDVFGHMESLYNGFSLICILIWWWQAGLIFAFIFLGHGLSLSDVGALFIWNRRETARLQVSGQLVATLSAESARPAPRCHRLLFSFSWNLYPNMSPRLNLSLSGVDTSFSILFTLDIYYVQLPLWGRAPYY